jgi:hypothetical protein
MALEETETVLKTRKDALFAKHIDGRDSYQELDHIFRPNQNYDFIKNDHLQ